MTNTFQSLLAFPELLPLQGDQSEANNNKNALILKQNSILTNLSANLCCPICQDVPTQPYLLPSCGHSFCYSCIKYWFQCNPSCPVCRSVIGDAKPILNHSLKNVLDSLFGDLSGLTKFLDPENSVKFKKLLQSWHVEKNEEFEVDKLNNFPWLKKLDSNWGRAVVDNEDGVPRCSACHWELIDGHCENCGRQMVGWQDRTDGDELDDEDESEELDEEDENLLNPRSANPLTSDEDQDWDDFDNGTRDVRGSMMHLEADESGFDEHTDNEDENERHHFSGHTFNDAYESDDGFVVDEDEFDEGEEREESEDSGLDSDDDRHNTYANTSDIELVDELASGDEDIIKGGRSIHEVSDISDDDIRTHSKRKRIVDDEDDDDDDDEAEDTEGLEEDGILQSSRPGRNKIILNDEDDTEDEENLKTDILLSEKKKQKRKDKHKHKHKHKYKSSHKHKKKRHE